MAVLKDWVFRWASLALDAVATLGQQTGRQDIGKASTPRRPCKLRGRPTAPACELTLALHAPCGVVVVSILLANGGEVTSVQLACFEICCSITAA